MLMPTTLEGMDKQLAQLAAIADKIPDGVGKALIGKTLAIGAESYKQCPVDQGDLRGTQYIDGPVIEGNQISTVIGYTPVYALRQHEDMSYHHNVGKARYLSDPIEARLPEMGYMVAEAFQNVYRELGL
jgi:hypothetical protein